MVEWRSGGAGVLQTQGREFKSCLDHQVKMAVVLPSNIIAFSSNQKSFRVNTFKYASNVI